MAATQNTQKLNFKECKRIQPFYTGGIVRTFQSGKLLLCSCGDAVNVIEITSGKVLHSISQDGDDVTCVISSPDHSMIVTASRSLLFKQWTLDGDLQCVRTWKAIHVSVIVCMDFDSTSTLLASGGSDSTIKCWDMKQQYCTHNLRGSKGVVNIVKFHPTELLLFSAASDYTIRVWNLNNSRCIGLLENHVSAITSLLFTNHDDKLQLLSGGRDSVITLWDVSNVTTNSSIPATKTMPVFEQLEGMVVLSSDEYESICKDSSSHGDITVLVAGSSGVLSVWNVTSGSKVFTQKLVNSDDAPTKSITYILPCENGICSVDEDHNISIYNKKDLTLVKQIIGYNDEILDVKFIGISHEYIAVASNTNQLKIFNLKTRSSQLISGHKDSILSLGVFNDNTTLVSTSKDKSVCLWKMHEDGSFKLLAQSGGHMQSVTCVACTRLTSQKFVTGSEDQTIKIWKIKDECDIKVLHTIKAHDKDVNCISISPNDKFVASGSQDKTAKLWKLSDGTELGVFRGHKRGIWTLQFSPMDQLLATASADGCIKLWTLNTCVCCKTFEGHDSSILNVLFLSKGMQLLSSGSDGLIKLWNIKDNECVCTLDAHEDKVWGLAANKDESLIVSVSADSNIIVWKDVTQQESLETQQENELVVLRHQELQNLIHEKSFTRALTLAIKLEQSFTALKIIKEILIIDTSKHSLKEVVGCLRQDQIDVLLKFIMSWNTNARNCHEAHAMLNIILHQTHPDNIMQLSNLQPAIEAILPYAEKHFDRVSRIFQQATFVDFIWQNMKLKPISEQATDSPKPAQSQKSFTIDKSKTDIQDQLNSIDAEKSTSDVEDCETDSSELEFGSDGSEITLKKSKTNRGESKTTLKSKKRIHRRRKPECVKVGV